MSEDAKKRKETPVKTGVLDYFPDAIRDIARCSYAGNEQHNPGTALHWDRSKSGDELDALTRHLLDAGTVDNDGIRHSTKVAWRALANLQKEIERERRDEYEEELIREGNITQFMYDGEECYGLLGSHPLCCTDYCPCLEEEISEEDIEKELYGVRRGPCSGHDEASEEELEKRMNIIGQNGNDGLHYDLPEDRYGDSSLNMTHDYDSINVAVSNTSPCGWDNTSKLSRYPEGNTTKDIKVTYEWVTSTNEEKEKKQ